MRLLLASRLQDEVRLSTAVRLQETVMRGRTGGRSSSVVKTCSKDLGLKPNVVQISERLKGTFSIKKCQVNHKSMTPGPAQVWTYIIY